MKTSVCFCFFLSHSELFIDTAYKVSRRYKRTLKVTKQSYAFMSVTEMLDVIFHALTLGYFLFSLEKVRTHKGCQCYISGITYDFSIPEFTDKITNDLAEYSLDWKRHVEVASPFHSPPDRFY